MEQAAVDAIRDGALYCYGMWSYMDADWLKKITAAVASGKKLTREAAGAGHENLQTDKIKKDLSGFNRGYDFPGLCGGFNILKKIQIFG